MVIVEPKKDINYLESDSSDEDTAGDVKITQAEATNMKQMIDTMMNRQSVKIQKQKNKTIILKKQLLKKWTGQADKEQIHMVMKVCGKIERKKWHHEREVMLAKIESQKNALEAKSMQIQELSLR